MPAPSVLTSLLLLGNSYIFTNDLDLRTDALLEEGQPTLAPVETLRLAEGGLTLPDHLQRATTPGNDWYDALSTDGVTWTWVVLQDQSQIPGFPDTEPAWQASRDAAIALDDLVEARGGATVFLLTWGRRDGDPTNDWLYPDFLTMQSLLDAGYAAWRDATSTPDRPTWIAPAGPAFRTVWNDVVAAGGDPLDPSSHFYSLYSSDGSHPSPLGTYLVACVLYATLTGASPEGLSAPSTVGSEAGWLQSAAAATVFDTDLGYTYPWSTPGETGEPDTGRPDTGNPETGAADTGRPDTGNPETGAADTGGAEEAPDEKGACGCGIGAAHRGWLLTALLALGLAAARRRGTATR